MGRLEAGSVAKLRVAFQVRVSYFQPVIFLSVVVKLPPGAAALNFKKWKFLPTFPTSPRVKAFGCARSHLSLVLW